METIITKYTTDLRTQATHLYSGSEITTDAPLDNNGKAEFFSPTDLLAAALASCMLTIMGILGRREGFSIDGTTARVTKIMGNDPRRIAEVLIELDFPANNYSDKEKKYIETAAKTCPVAKSLHADLKQTIHFHYH
ncbi:MAG: OsmC family protein [Bacteroidota bacterium]